MRNGISEGRLRLGRPTLVGTLTRLVDEQWLADIGYFRDGAFQVKRLGEHNLENLFDRSVVDNGQAGGCNRRTFWTLMLWLVLLKINAARIAFAKRRACNSISHMKNYAGLPVSWMVIPGSRFLPVPRVTDSQSDRILSPREPELPSC